MPQPIIHFAHSNGFPGAVYGKIFRLLEPDFRVIYKDLLAHDPAFPVRSGWEEQADELIQYLIETAKEPVLGVGHSFGASITYMAAVKRPDLFRGLILLEPILFIGLGRFLIAAAKRLGMMDRLSPAGKTKNRKRYWPDKQAAELYFKSKPLFCNFDEECLRDYIEHGLIRSGEGYVLRFQVEQEVSIFRNGPHHFDRYRGFLKNMPVHVVSADQTDAIPIPMVRRFAEQNGFHFQVVPGKHMFPLEQPDDTATLIRTLAADINRSVL